MCDLHISHTIVFTADIQKNVQTAIHTFADGRKFCGEIIQRKQFVFISSIL